MALKDRIKAMSMFPDFGAIQSEIEAKFDALIAKLDEILAELKRQGSQQTGQLGIIAGVILVVLVLAMIGLFHVCTDDDDNGRSLGRVELVGYRGGPDCYRYGECSDHRRGEDRSDRRDDNRRAGISPGPFDRSPVDLRDNRVVICFPFARCDAKDGEGDGNAQQP